MTLKVNDVVIIPASATVPDSLSTPRFGGKYGMVYGVVEKVLTGYHDATLHRVVVKWGNGHTWNLPEKDLSVVDMSNPPRVEPKDGIYLFLRPSKDFKGLRVGMVSEDFEPGPATRKDSWVSIMAKPPIPSGISEEELLNKLSEHLPVAATHDTKLDAVNHILTENGFPALTSPYNTEHVPLFPTIQAARDSEGDCRDRGYLLFTLSS